MFCKNCGKEMTDNAAFCPNCGVKPGGETQAAAAPSTTAKTTTGLEPNIAGLLCYLGAWVTGIIFLVLEKENKTVRFHAVQSIVIFGAYTILQIIIGILNIFVPFIWILSTIVYIALVATWIYLMVMTYQGKMIRIPVAADFADKYSK
jgi:uncharacterized membrane protein